MVVVFGRSRRPFNCSGGCVREVYARKYEKWLKEETNGGKSRGVFMIYTSCEPSRTYGVVLIFLWVVETIWTSEPNSLVSIQALVASFNLFLEK